MHAQLAQRSQTRPQPRGHASVRSRDSPQKEQSAHQLFLRTGCGHGREQVMISLFEGGGTERERERDRETEREGGEREGKGKMCVCERESVRGEKIVGMGGW